MFKYHSFMMNESLNPFKKCKIYGELPFEPGLIDMEKHVPEPKMNIDSYYCVERSKIFGSCLLPRYNYPYFPYFKFFPARVSFDVTFLTSKHHS